MRERLEDIGRGWTFALLLGVGCSGVIGEGSSPPERPDPPAPTSALPPWNEAPELRLLAPREYAASVADLLGVEVESSEVPPVQVSAGHGGIAAVQRVTYDDADRYYALAERSAARWRESADACAGEACRAFVAALARRAFRSDEGVDGISALLDDPSAGEDLDARSETAVIAILTSPRFLYRREVVEESWWSDRTIATRLAYLVWESGPDDALFELADRGALRSADGRVAALDRLLDDPRARRGTRGFVFDWMGVFDDRIASKSEATLEGTSATFPQHARQSLERTIDEVLDAPDAAFVDLLVATNVYVDDELARVLDVDAPTDPTALEPRALDTSRRLGLLTHPTVLASHTKESGPSPFPIGKFLLENLLCEPIPAPPPVPSVDAEAEAADTLRQRLEALTAHGVCQGCHRRIGPAGFAFLPFDPIGRHRPTDGAGRAWDTSGEIPREGTTALAFDDAPGLARALADDPAVRACVARRLFRWAFGRFEGPQDEAFVAELEQVASEDGGSVRAVLESLVRSEAFAHAGGGR